MAEAHKTDVPPVVTGKQLKKADSAVADAREAYEKTQEAATEAARYADLPPEVRKARIEKRKAADALRAAELDKRRKDKAARQAVLDGTAPSDSIPVTRQT